MVGAYALIYPWTFAIGLVTLLFIHEMGHVWAARRKGLPVSAPAFIPFMGALIMLKQQPKDAETEAFIAYGGPLIGSLGALAVFGAAQMTQYAPLYAIAQVGFFLNLINLLPIHPLDGGRIVTAISRWLWVVGLIGGLLVIIYLKAFLFLFFWALFAWELYAKFVRKNKDSNEDRMMETEVELAIDRTRFEAAAPMIPAEQHRRALVFTQFCRLEDHAHLCEVEYPGLGKLGEFAFEQGVIQSVNLFRTFQLGETVTMRFQITYHANPETRPVGWIQDESYYQVRPGTRILYGAAYLGLALSLGWLMYYTAVSAPKPPLVG